MSSTPKRTHGSVKCFIVFSTCALAFMSHRSAASGTENEGYAAHKREQLSALHAEFTREYKAYEHDDAVIQTREKLELIDEAANFLLKSLQTTESTTYENILNGSIDVVKDEATEKPEETSGNALELYMEFADRLSAGLPSGSVGQKRLSFLRKYCNAALDCAVEYVRRRTEIAAAADENARREVLELSVVLPFLKVPDEKWSSKNIEALPKWANRPEDRKLWEEFALSVRRPLTALQFAQYGESKPWNADKALRYYVVRARLLTERSSQYSAGIQCFRASIDVAESNGRDDSAMSIRQELAKTFHQIGHPRLAAATVKEAMDLHPESSSWGKAAMLRLRYLYEAGEHVTIINEGPNYQTDVRCAKYHPQVIYVLWVTHRRANKPEAAEKLQRTFLEKFPEHTLAADMYFASAMKALAAGDYDEALRLLEVIEYRYPSSRIVKKARQIQSRLTKRTSGKTGN